MAEINLVEREELLDTLTGHLENARHSSGSMVLLAGEAGSGKTSLARAYVEQTGQRALAMVGACDPLSTPRPLSPLLDFAADPDSGLDDLLSGDRDNIEVFSAVLDRLRHTIRPIIMVVEDIHWADQGTLDFLRFIGRRIESSKGVVLCTYRDDEIGPDHPLRPILGQLAPLPSTHRLSVPPLSRQAVGTLAEDSGMDPDELHRITGGNAFYVTEVIAGGKSLPATVQDAVAARVSRLEKGPRQVVEAVSIAPRALGVDQAISLAGGRSGHVDEAVATGVIISDRTGLRFRHELARSAIEQSIPPARRFSLHRRMIALLLEDDPPDHARMAHHAIEALQPDLIIEYAPTAARQASSRGAHKETISFYRTALDHADLMGEDRSAALRVELSEELGIVDLQQQALEEAQLALHHYRRTEEKQKLAKALTRLASAQWRLTDREGSRASTDEAVDLLRGLGPSRDLAYALYMSSHFHMLSRQADPASRDVAEAETVARETGSDDVLWLTLMMRGCISVVVGDASQGVAILTESLELAKSADDHRSVAVSLSMLGSGGGEARLYDYALAALEESVEQGLATDQDYGVAYSRSWLARIAFERGRWDDAVAYAELVDRTSLSRKGIAIVTAKGALGRVLVRRGDPEGRLILEEVIGLGEGHELQHVWSPLCGLAEHHWLAGDTEAMIPVLENAYERALDTDSEWARGEVGFWMWKAGAIDAPPNRTAEPFELHMSGKWREAAEAWREIGCPYEVGLALAEGDEEALLEALSIFDSLGARPAGNLARSRLRGLGVESIPRGPTPETAGNPAGLTARQMEVLGLIVNGLTNSDIADELYLSKKTVEHHVSAIYSKLGVGTRSKAIAAANRLDVGAR